MASLTIFLLLPTPFLTPSSPTPFSLPFPRPRIQLGSLDSAVRLEAKPMLVGLGKAPADKQFWCLFEQQRVALVASLWIFLRRN